MRRLGTLSHALLLGFACLVAVQLKFASALSTDIRDERPGTLAISADTFLNSLGVNIHASQGYNASAYVGLLDYIGVRNIRDSDGSLDSLLMLHQKLGVKVDLGLWCNLESEMASAERLAAAGALLAIEGPNEPNNFGIKYDGQPGGRADSWDPVARCQRDIYQKFKQNPKLASFPIFAVSEAGAEPVNLGLQFLTIPAGAGTSMPEGTQYADYANAHNYVSSTNNKLYVDNQAWKAADPTLREWWDGLSSEYGHTWFKGFTGYNNEQLQTLPRVTTETGWDTSTNIGGQDVQGKVLVNTFLSQFKRGWAYTFLYELVDSEGSLGEQGLFTKTYAPKLAATYIHNLTSILADRPSDAGTAYLDYAVTGSLSAEHDLALHKASGAFALLVWGEQVNGANDIQIHFGRKHETVNVYDVIEGTKPSRTYHDVQSIPLSISDHAFILEIMH